MPSSMRITPIAIKARFIARTLSQMERWSDFEARIDTPRRQNQRGMKETAGREELLRGGGFFGSSSDGGSLAAALGLGRRCRRFADQFGSHHASDEELRAVIIEIDRGALGVR